jgi:hypothetical protein
MSVNGTVRGAKLHLTKSKPDTVPVFPMQLSVRLLIYRQIREM